MKTENYILNLSEFIPHWFEDVHQLKNLKLAYGEVVLALLKKGFTHNRSTTT
jgi:hypothetical protein